MTLAEAVLTRLRPLFCNRRRGKTGDMLRFKYTTQFDLSVSYHLNYNRAEIIYIPLQVW